MSVRSLVEFVAMREGTHDMIYKNYDLMYLANRNRTRRALYRLGLVYDEISICLDMVAGALRTWEQPVARADIAELLNEWFVWDRIKSGELRTWKYRKGRRGTSVKCVVTKSGVVSVRSGRRQSLA